MSELLSVLTPCAHWCVDYIMCTLVQILVYWCLLSVVSTLVCRMLLHWCVVRVVLTLGLYVYLWCVHRCIPDGFIKTFACSWIFNWYDGPSAFKWCGCAVNLTIFFCIQFNQRAISRSMCFNKAEIARTGHKHSVQDLSDQYTRPDIVDKVRNGWLNFHGT